MKRKYLTQSEIGRMMASTLTTKNGARDRCLIMLCFHHGFRISEILRLQISDIVLDEGYIDIRRLKNGFSTVHPLLPAGREALQMWMRERETWKVGEDCSEVFISRRGTVMSRQQAYRIIRQSGEDAGLAVNTYPHMLRHACGYALADRGVDTRLIQDYLGHRNIRHTVRYTASNAGRFKGLWERENNGGERVRIGQLGPNCEHI